MVTRCRYKMNPVLVPPVQEKTCRICRLEQHDDDEDEMLVFVKGMRCGETVVSSLFSCCRCHHLLFL